MTEKSITEYVISKFKNDVIPIDRSNTLITLNKTSKAVKLDISPDKLHDLMCINCKDIFLFDGSASNINPQPNSINSEIIGNKTNSDFLKSIIKINNEYLLCERNDGIWIGHAILSFIVWKDNISDEQIENISPLIIHKFEYDINIPNIKIKGYGDCNREVNPSLVKLFKEKYSIDLPIIMDTESVISYTEKIIKILRNKNIFEVNDYSDNVLLTKLNFPSLLIYNDYVENDKKFAESIALNKLTGGKKYGINEGNFFDEINLIYNADDSQKEIISNCLSNNSIVIQGPPGTGKSLTIANLITQLVLNNKKILFVTQKPAAVEAVIKHFDDKKLNNIYLDLHNDKMKSIEAYRKIIQILKNDRFENVDNENIILSYKEKRDLIEKNYNNIINKILTDLNISYYDALTELNRLDNKADFGLSITFDSDPVLKCDWGKFRLLLNNNKNILIKYYSIYRSISTLQEYKKLKNQDSGKLLKEAHDQIKISRNVLTGYVEKNLKNDRYTTDLNIDDLIKISKKISISYDLYEEYGKHENFRKQYFSILGLDEKKIQKSLKDIGYLIEEAKHLKLKINKLKNELNVEIFETDRLKNLNTEKIVLLSDDLKLKDLDSLSDFFSTAKYVEDVLSKITDNDYSHLSTMSMEEISEVAEYFKKLFESYFNFKVIETTFERNKYMSLVDSLLHYLPLLSQNKNIILDKIFPYAEQHSGVINITYLLSRKMTKSGNIKKRKNDVKSWFENYKKVYDIISSINKTTFYEYNIQSKIKMSEGGENLIVVENIEYIEILRKLCIFLNQNTISHSFLHDILKLDIVTLSKKINTLRNSSTLLVNINSIKEMSAIAHGLESNVNDLSKYKYTHSGLSFKKYSELLDLNNSILNKIDSIKYYLETLSNGAEFSVNYNDFESSYYFVEKIINNLEILNFMSERFNFNFDLNQEVLNAASNILRLSQENDKKINIMDIIIDRNGIIIEENTEYLANIIEHYATSLETLTSVSAGFAGEIDKVAKEGNVEIIEDRILASYLTNSINSYLSTLKSTDFICATDIDKITNEYLDIEKKISKIAINSLLNKRKEEIWNFKKRNNDNQINDRNKGYEVGYAYFKNVLRNAERATNFSKTGLRTFFSHCEDIIKFTLDLAPCIIASPESVSKYLPCDQLFDVVIFDESSQIFFYKAIPSFARAKNFIVAGDDKQLQPTSFFQSKEDISDDFDELVDLNSDISLLTYTAKESELKEYVSLNLKWHYRSTHHDLIRHSVEKFYRNDELYWFPTARPLDNNSGVEFVKIESNSYKNGMNLDTANKCIEIYELIRNSNNTIGIITFSKGQQDLIRDLLIDRNLFDKFSKGIDNVINIEGVQGDEYDIIILDFPYGKDTEGKFHKRFGPINSINGKNRLNVAITRARRKLYLVSSVDYTDFSPPSSKSESTDQQSGNDLLRDWFMFVEKPKPIHEDTYENDKYESNFEEEVGIALKKLLKKYDGRYEIRTHIGADKYFIDLGIYDRIEKRYVLGIECDGNRYHSSVSARSWDKIRENYLVHKLGWTIFRVRSNKWFLDKNIVINQIEAYLN